MEQLTQMTGEENLSACCCFADSRRLLATIQPSKFLPWYKHLQCSAEVKLLCGEIQDR